MLKPADLARGGVSRAPLAAAPCRGYAGLGEVAAMTEAEWLASRAPEAMLEYLQRDGDACDRKLRLFACGCYRASSPHPAAARADAWVDTAEAFADGRTSREALGLAGRRADSALRGARCGVPLGLFFAAWATDPDLEGVTNIANPDAGHTRPPIPHALQADLLRCVFGNPFRPASLDPSCLTPTVIALAESTYDERQWPTRHLDPARLAVLADALEEAGCALADVLAHLRSAGAHVRGCFAVDLVLRRE
jgi:hypothetical protein